MDVLEVLLRLVGIFYILAGGIIMRAIVMDHLMDQMLAGITLKPIPGKENQRRWIGVATALAVGMGGAALMVLSLWAVPIFVAGMVIQLGYLAWARIAFVPEDDLDRKGRRQTINAALFYGLATAVVCAAAVTGMLHPWLDPLALIIPVAGAALLVTVGRHFLWKARPLNASDEPVPPRPIKPRPARIRLAPMKGFYPVRDADNDDGVIYDDYVPEQLGDRIYAWIQAFHANDDWDDPEFWAEFASPSYEAGHRAEGAAIVAELEAIFGAGNVEGPVYPDDIRHIPLTDSDLEP